MLVKENVHCFIVITNRVLKNAIKLGQTIIIELYEQIIVVRAFRYGQQAD